MKKLKDPGYLVTYTEIYPFTHENIPYKLSANIDENGKYFMPSLQLVGISRERARGEGLETYWDSEYFLVETLYRTLTYLIDGIGVVDWDEISFIRRHIPESDYQVVLDIIDQGIALGFFKEYYDQVNYPDEQK